MDTLEDIEGQLEDQSSAHFMTGATVTTLDLRRIMASDLRLTIGLVLGGIFIILVIMLRSLVAPLYLIGTIVLSFGATLGLTRLVTGPLFGEERLVFWVPFMMFVFLVALGIDYSIFLFSRIKEEMGRGGAMQPAVVRSVGMTGAIITSAGVIVAGSFIALTTGDIIGLQQVGFAVGAGILIDTVVIRTVLVPAIALMVGRWSWWPGGLFRAGQPDAVQPRPERVTVP
jgi:RND superfamily putative drug exporter